MFLFTFTLHECGAHGLIKSNFILQFKKYWCTLLGSPRSQYPGPLGKVGKALPSRRGLTTETNRPPSKLLYDVTSTKLPQMNTTDRERGGNNTEYDDVKRGVRIISRVGG